MAAKQFFLPYQAATINAVAEPGATLTFYQTGTTTKLPIYTTALLDTELANPVRANGAGRFADIYLDSTQTYRLIISDRNGTALEDIDPYTPGTIQIGVTDGTDDILATNYGAVFNNVTDDHAGMQAALQASEDQAGNGGGGGFYLGGPQVMLPAGVTGYMAANALDIRHSMIFRGKGAGRWGPLGRGVSSLRFAAGTSGIRVQSPNTSGDITVTTDHLGSGGVTIEHMMLQGPENGTEESVDGSIDASCADNNIGIDLHKQATLTDIYIRGFKGIGVKAWAGTVHGVAYSGDVSLSACYGVKVESCQIAFSRAGSDGNILTDINCEAVTCGQAGFVTDLGIGPWIAIGNHATANGLLSTQLSYKCHYSGKIYAAVWGKTIAQLTANAPSGTTADNAYWYYIEAGTADTVVKTWDGSQQFRAGGDYITAGPDNPSQVALLLGCYSENPGVSQFGPSTLLVNCDIADIYRKGGVHLKAIGNKLFCPESVHFGGTLTVDGFTHTLGDNTAAAGSDHTLNLDSTSGSVQVNFRTAGATVVGYMNIISGNGFYLNAPAANGYIFRLGGTQVASLDATGLQLASGKVVTVNAQQVVGARGAAVTRIARTATSGSLPVADGSITIANAATPTVAELLEYCTEIEAKLEELTAKFRAATGHGLIA
jgi:hypothetical protein